MFEFRMSDVGDEDDFGYLDMRRLNFELDGTYLENWRRKREFATYILHI